MTTATALLALAAAWSGALLGIATAGGPAPGGGVAPATVLVAVLVTAAAVGPRGGRGWCAAAVVLVASTATVGGIARTAAIDRGPLALATASRPTAVVVEGVIVTDVRDGPTGGRWMVVRLRTVTAPGGPSMATRERVVLRLPAAAARAAPAGPPADAGAAPAVDLGVTLRATGLAQLIEGPATPALRTRGAVVAVDAADVEVVAGPPSWIGATTRLRTAVREAATARLPPAEATLLTGLVTGDLTGQPDAVADDVRASGLSHLVAVSGSNVALVVAATLGLLLLLGADRRTAWWAALATTWWFVVLVRAEPSVLRAAATASLVLGAMLVGRRRALPQLLCTAATGLLLVDPLLASRLGFALSVAATGGVLLLAPLVDGVLAARLPALPDALRRVLAATTGAQLAVAPILLAAGGDVHPASLPANALAVPAAAAASAVGTVVAVAAPAWPAAAATAALAARPALGVVLWSARTFAGPTGRSVAVWSLAAAAVVLLAAAAADRGARRLAPRPLAAAAVVLAVVAVPVQRAARPTGGPPATAVVIAMDVGQGDAVLLGDPVGGWLLVDGGPVDGDVVAGLRRHGVDELRAVVATHPHADHVDGLPAVLAAVDVGVLLVGPSGTTPELTRAAADHDVPVRTIAAGDGWRLGTTALVVLAPPATGLGEEPNDNSVVLRADHGGGSALLAGDAEVLTQALLRGDPRADVDVLKVPHHGGATNLDGFLTGTTPDVAVISVGAGNPFGHPHPDVLAELAGTEVRRTDVEGDVVVPLAGAPP